MVRSLLIIHRRSFLAIVRLLWRLKIGFGKHFDERGLLSCFQTSSILGVLDGDAPPDGAVLLRRGSSPGRLCFGGLHGPRQATRSRDTGEMGFGISKS